MPQIRGIIFDMDGTLVDSRLDYDAIRREMGLPAGMPILEGLEQVPDGTLMNFEVPMKRFRSKESWNS